MHFDFAGESPVALLCSTSSAVLTRKSLTSHFKEVFTMPLQDALLQAATAARQNLTIGTHVSSNLHGSLERVALILEKLAGNMSISTDYYPADFQTQIDKEIKDLDHSVGTTFAIVWS
jgi:hypothetical protein